MKSNDFILIAQFQELEAVVDKLDVLEVLLSKTIWLVSLEDAFILAVDYDEVVEPGQDDDPVHFMHHLVRRTLNDIILFELLANALFILMKKFWRDFLVADHVPVSRLHHINVVCQVYDGFHNFISFLWDQID